MSQQDLLETAEVVAGLIPRLARGLTSAEKDPADNLPLAQLRLCGILSEGPRPMSALSRELGVSLSALTQIADRLERARLVKRVAAGNDRRVRCLQLTVRAEKMMRKRREVRVLRHWRCWNVFPHASAKRCGHRWKPSCMPAPPRKSAQKPKRPLATQTPLTPSGPLKGEPQPAMAPNPK